MKKKTIRQRMWNERWSYIFIAPTFILFLLFTFRSMIFSFYYAMHEWRGIGAVDAFIGLSNFFDVAKDPFFWNAFKNSFIFMLGVAPGQLTIGLLFAIILNMKFKGAVFFRTFYFLPVITTTAIIGLVMPMIFSPISGPVNVVMIKLGLIQSPVDWVGSPDTAMPTVIVVAIWKWMGVYMVYWLAGLQSIPDELYEASEVEGANKWQQFWLITLPLLKNIAIVIVLLCVVNNLKPFALIKTMTNGGPYYRTDVVMTYMYRFAFDPELGLPRLGYSASAGIFYGIVVMLITAIQVFIGRRVQAGTERAAAADRRSAVTPGGIS